MERHINTYGGMNKDIGYDSIPPNYYIDAQDIRITTTDGESMGSWTNIKGNKVSFNIPTDSEDAFPVGEPFGPWTADNPEIIGYTTIRNRIILFVADDSDTKGWIYDVQYDPATREILPDFPSLKYYSDIFNLKKEWPIEALGRYESNCIQRVYWTDYNNFFRSLNIEDSELTSLPVGLVDIFPDVEYTQPLLKLVTGGGQLLSGVYQVAYRLKTFDGKQTLVSPPSNLIHVVADSELEVQSARYNANPIQVNTNKALTIEIDTSNYGDFETIELISLYFEDGNSIPTAQTIEEVSIGSQLSVTFNYTGAEGTIFDLELFTFASKNYAFKTPKTITQKDSSLVAANIKGSVVSVKTLLPPGETFDAKTRRYLNDGVSTPWPIDPDPLDPQENNLKNAFNTNVDPVLYPLDPNPDAGFNTDAHWDDYWNTNKQFKYQSDGATIGGEGPNITYKFHLEPFTIDGNNPTAGFGSVANIPDFPPHNLNDGYGDYANTTFPNNASPFISGLLRGYKRGETYRFGIVFYTKKGEATFVEYIGDIKFPDISDVDGAETIPGSGIQYFPTALADGNDTIGYSLGIQFSIDFTSCPSLYNNIESYQIVRVRRAETDKRRISQGMIKTFWKYIISTPPGSSNFDLRVDSSEDVLHLNPYYPVVGTIGPMAGMINGTFRVLEDMEPYAGGTSPGGITVSANYYVKGQYLGFYSPDISYGTYGVPDLGTTLSNNPSLLLTGAYFSTYDRDLVAGPIDLTAQDLGDSCRDYRRTIRSTYPTSFYSKENIKRWVRNDRFNMTDTIGYNSPVTPAFEDTNPATSYYMRNYYAIADYNDTTVPGDTLNDPQGGSTVTTDTPEIYKAGTSIIGRIGKVTTDPLFPGNPITASADDYFNTVSEIAPLNPNTLVPNSLLKPDVTPIMDLVLPKVEVYGGFNYDALEANIFIPASPVLDKTTSGANIFGGDIFITMFTLQTGTIEFNKDFYKIGTVFTGAYRQTNSTTELFPVEANINIDLAYGATVKTGVEYLHNGLQLEILRQETNNVETTYGKDNNMYRLNRVNERENDQVKFFIESQSQKDCGAPVNDVRTYLSNVKTNEESIDSWTKFEINSFYDIDDYGPINRILNWKDIVYFIQDRALGVYAINRAAITTTADGVPTELGTGKGFGKHQYYTKEHGSIHQWGVKSTDSGIYFFDALHRKIFMFAASGQQSQNNPISEIKGIHSLLQSLPDAVFFRKENGGDNPILKKGITIGRDKINDEVLFTFLGTGDYVDFSPGSTYTAGTIVFLTDSGLYYLVLVEFTASEDKDEAIQELLENSEVAQNLESFRDLTIVYDEIADQFSSMYSAKPKIYLENGDILQTPDPLNPEEIYTHNIGNYGEFYGVVQECELSLVINPNADINKVLRTLEFNSIVRDSNKVVDRTITITGFRVKNEYQDSGIIPYSANRIKRRFDKWRVKLPRDLNSPSQRARFRSSHFIVTLYFDNQVNKEIIMNRLMSYYDIQIF